MVSGQRSNQQYLIVGAATFLNIVSYIDRSAISVAAPSMRREFHLSPTQLGLVFSSFLLSYALLQAPWGMVADRVGPRRIVTFAILSWSAFTALTGAATSYVMLIAIRFAFGGMEAALVPSIVSAFPRWLPAKWRTTAFGIFLSGGRLGGAMAPVITAFILLRYGWRLTFLAIALFGLIAAVVWTKIAPVPLSNAEAPLDVPKKSARVWSFRMPALMLAIFGYTVMWQFYATWYPTYLVERRGFSLTQAASYAAVPFLLGIGSNWLGGMLCDDVSHRIGAARARAILGFLALLAASVLFYFGVISSSKVAPFMFAAAAAVGDLFLPMAWGAATDFGGKSAGVFGGLMNSASNLGGFLSPIMIGAAVQHWRTWDYALTMGAVVTLLAAFLWFSANWPAKTLDAPTRKLRGRWAKS